MTTQDIQQERYCTDMGRSHRNARLAIGVLVALTGLTILGNRLGLLHLHFRVWPLILIAIGLYSGIKHQFRGLGSWVLIGLGILFLIPRFLVFGVLSHHLIAPLLLIGAGLYIIFRPRRHRWKGKLPDAAIDEDAIHLDVSFGERSATVTSRNFTGGYISNTFGETRLNLLQADGPSPIELNLKVAFGSVDILVPANWDLETRMDNSFASVEDKRVMHMVSAADRKTLILKGSCSFGSVTVSSM